jgi:hypothetical protein
VVPLVFKTSLGIVRSPEGSTPSLLRQAPGNQLVTLRIVPLTNAPIFRAVVIC